MTSSAITLPKKLALFPLRSAVLLPRTRLPLNIFEPRFLAMTDYALGHDRLIGMVRPRHDDDVNPPIYEVGCAGRVISFSETGDGRYLIELAGVSRFRVEEEDLCDGGFRLASVDWSGFAADLAVAPEAEEPPALRERVLDLLMRYLTEIGLAADWDSIEGASAETIINSVAMSCPFEAEEKQALLEAPSLTHRAEILISLMEIAVADAHVERTSEARNRVQ